MHLLHCWNLFQWWSSMLDLFDFSRPIACYNSPSRRLLLMAIAPDKSQDRCSNCTAGTYTSSQNSSTCKICPQVCSHTICSCFYVLYASATDNLRGRFPPRAQPFVSSAPTRNILRPTRRAARSAPWTSTRRR